MSFLGLLEVTYHIHQCKIHALTTNTIEVLQKQTSKHTPNPEILHHPPNIFLLSMNVNSCQYVILLPDTQVIPPLKHTAKLIRGLPDEQTIVKFLRRDNGISGAFLMPRRGLTGMVMMDGKWA